MSAIDRIIADLRKYQMAPVEPDYSCAACRDTGWVELDDGLEDGRRVRAPKEARCTSLLHSVKSRVAPANAERFS